MSPWLVICRKELVDVGRDRKALLSLLIFPVLGPLMVFFMLNMIIDMGDEARDVTLPVIGADNGTDLVDFLEQNGVQVEALDIEPGVTFNEALSTALRQNIAQREYDFVLVIPADFEDQVANSRTVNLELHHDSSRTGAQARKRRVELLVSAWSSETAALRLMLRGIPGQLVSPVNLVQVDVASPQARANTILGMVPLFVIMAAFVGGMGVAVDATAGERERKSLEPLLVNPVSRTSIVIGKWAAAMVFSVAALLVVMSLNLLVLARVPLETIGISYAVGPTEIIGILLTTIPLAMFATSLQIFIGIFARSFKDAQTYLSLVLMLPMVPYLFNILNTSGRQLWMNFVPMLGQNMLLSDVVSGRTPALADFLMAGLTLTAFCGLLVFLSARAFQRENIIFT